MKFLWKNKILCLSILLIFTNGCDETTISEDTRTENNRSKNHHPRNRADIDLCPEAGFSDEQKAKVKELRQSFRNSFRDIGREDRQDTWSELQQNILETVPTTEEQKAALSKCFERRQGKLQL